MRYKQERQNQAANIKREIRQQPDDGREAHREGDQPIERGYPQKALEQERAWRFSYADRAHDEARD